MLREAMWSGKTSAGGRGCESAAFRLDVTPVAIRLVYTSTQYISLTLHDIDYLSLMFSVVQQQLRDYVVALQDVLPYVTATLTSVSYVEPTPDESN